MIFKNEDEARGYLAAMIDGEGSVTDVHRGKRVDIYNKDREILYSCRSACVMLGITKVRIHEMKTRDYAQLVITGYNNFKIISTLPLRSEKKRKKVIECLNSYVRLPDGPYHTEETLNKMREAQKRRWDKISEDERKKIMADMRSKRKNKQIKVDAKKLLENMGVEV